MSIYNLTPEETEKLYQTNHQNGLTSSQVEALKKIHGLNELITKPRRSIIKIFFAQFHNPLIYLLLMAAIAITFFGNYTDAIVTLIVVFLNACLGTFYERNARHTIEQLKKLVTVSVLVIRQGKRIITDAGDLVPGDLIVLHEGDQVPADSRLIQAHELLINESMLTGESKSITKNTTALSGIKPLFEQSNMIFRGTIVTSGSGLAIVTATGKHSEIGKIQTETEEAETISPLQNELNRLSRYLLVAACILCGVLFALGYATGHSLQELLIIVTALFISIIPEGLPVVFTLALAAGARRLLRRNVLVKKLPSAEGLGRIDVIVIDKTGTLTRNELMAQKIWLEESPEQSFPASDMHHTTQSRGTFCDVSGQGYLPDGTLTCADKSIDITRNTQLLLLRDAAGLLDSSDKKCDAQSKHFQIKGEPLEAALGVFAHKLNFQADTYAKLFESSFDFISRIKTCVCEQNNRLFIFASGAPESIIGLCTSISPDAHNALAKLLHEGLRVVALSVFKSATMPDNITDWQAYAKNCAGSFQLLGFIGIQDAIRAEVKDAIAQARQAGLDIIMATGDHQETANHIARQTGILTLGDISITGSEIAAQSIEKLDLEKIKVCARVTPYDKLALINALRKNKKIVAMTGDGINDIPSLVAASIGIAMGSGADVAKESADLILLDDSFASIVRAIEEGRHIFSTLRRVIWYLFSTNLSEVLVVFYAFMVDWPLPLRAAQILWLNFVTDGFLDVALSMEPHEKGLLSPRWLTRSGSKKHRLIDGSLLTKILFDAIVMTAGSLVVFGMWCNIDLPTAQTMMLVCLALFQWFNAWNCRSERLSIFRSGLFTNRPLIAATLIVLGLQLCVVYVPAFQFLFKTVPLTLGHWTIITMIASSIIFAEELRKAIMRHKSEKIKK